MNGGPVQNDALAWLRRQPSGLADALVTDPPAGPQGAARPAWTAWTAWLAEVFLEVRRALRPGAAGFVRATVQRSHWTATACEKAGFEVRDVLTHVAGTVERGTTTEHWILLRAPAPGPLLNLRIDDCRVPGAVERPGGMIRRSRHFDRGRDDETLTSPPDPHPAGRWPANFVLSHAPACKPHGVRRVEDCAAGCLVKALGEQSGSRTSTRKRILVKGRSGGIMGKQGGDRDYIGGFDDAGTAARFFHCYPAASAAVLLRQHLCRLVTPPRGLVLDPFPRSGTTAAAARAEGLRLASPPEGVMP